MWEENSACTNIEFYYVHDGYSSLVLGVVDDVWDRILGKECLFIQNNVKRDCSKTNVIEDDSLDGISCRQTDRLLDMSNPRCAQHSSSPATYLMLLQIYLKTSGKAFTKTENSQGSSSSLMLQCILSSPHECLQNVPLVL